nr:outer membrane protein assembly factor BamE [Candidatus Photodesmus katoptron]
MFKKLFFSCLLLLISVISLMGCSSLQRLVYRIDIRQGNYVEQKSVDKLRFGMSKEQVRYIMGSPMLIENNHINTWYYIYYYAKNHNNPVQKNLILNFNSSEKLIDFSGDFAINLFFNNI